MTSLQVAALAAAVWLDSGIPRAPDPNELASVANRLVPDSDSLAVVLACVEVVPHVEWVLECRAKPELIHNDVPRW